MAQGLWIFGNGNRDDSFGICIRYILSKFRLGASQSWVDGLSGMAFSLPFVPAEDCSAWWMEGGNDIRAEFVAGALGLSYEKLTIKSGHSEEPDTCRDGAFWESVREKVETGSIVLENTWPLWSIIDGWKEDKPERVFFEGFPIFPNPDGVFHVFGRDDNKLSIKDAVGQALESGQKLMGNTLDTNEIKYGDVILKAVKKQLQEEFFCKSCGKDDFGCFTRSLARIRGQQMSLAGFIEEAGQFADIPEIFTEMAAKASTVSHDILEILKNPELENFWSDKQKIASMLPF